MSYLVKDLLEEMELLDITTKSDRKQIDKEIEKRKGCNCDEAILAGFITAEELEYIVYDIISNFRRQEIKNVRKKRKKLE